MKENVLKIIYQTLDEINENLHHDSKIPKSEENEIFGENSLLDSISFVNLIVEVEQKIYDSIGIELILADERAMSQEQSPFKTVGTLAEYITLLISEKSEK